MLAAATSIATKNNEESLTYLNQGQSYEIKLKKLGDLSPFRGKILKSIIKICFHERRLQYMEREQMQLWQASRPGERILDVDIPLSYGLMQVQPTSSNLLNTIEVFWDPMKEVGVYVKVNCISTEFTPKKHGGEKGVPFRIQVETYIDTNGGGGGGGANVAPVGGVDDKDGIRPLHAAACQIKVRVFGVGRESDRERVTDCAACFAFPDRRSTGVQIEGSRPEAQTGSGENTQASGGGAGEVPAQLRLHDTERHYDRFRHPAARWQL